MARKSPIGIDLGTSSVKAAQLTRLANDWTPAALARHNVEWKTRDDIDDESLTASVRAILSGGDFKGKRAVLTAPASIVDIRPVNVPLTAGGDLLGFVQSEIAERRGEPAGAFVCDYWIAGETVEHGEEKLQLFSVSVPHDAIGAIIRAVERAGLICDRVETTATALAHAIACKPGAAVTVLDIGAMCSLLMTFTNEGITFCRPVKWGAVNVVRAVKDALDIDMETATQIVTEWGLTPIAGDADDLGDAHPRQQLINDTIEKELRTLALEIGRSLTFRAGSTEGAVTELAVVGSGSLLKGLPRFLKDALKLNLKPAPIHGTLTALDDTEDNDANEICETYAVAIGAAHCGVR